MHKVLFDLVHHFPFYFWFQFLIFLFSIFLTSFTHHYWVVGLLPVLIHSSIVINIFKQLNLWCSWAVCKKKKHDSSPLDKIAVLPIYGKTPFKVFFSRSKKEGMLKFSTKHYWHKAYEVCSIEDCKLTIHLSIRRSVWLSNPQKIKVYMYVHAIFNLFSAKLCSLLTNIESGDRWRLTKWK